jgi:ATP-dependent exoDNAse (exonuclease V) beta subunit
MGMLGEFSLTDTPGGSGEIFWTNIYQFKGLESPVVILVEIDTHVRSNDIAEITIDTEAQLASSRVVLTPEMLMYVGTSRARHHLIVAMQE